ncbi:PorT family protein [Hymenobacter sp. NST-14]|uniref:porin family protein n=1 Tax=Hymenobacter piscis TaxID=2839984 RepID=UPI001C00C336|nr:porin family protein [Hymenobacter piscis]MBT9394962.1 PorT family protein [Hymenobacter piscis]
MKTILLSTLALLALGVAAPANAQNVRLGLKGGLNYSRLSFYLEDPGWLLGPAAGVFAQIPLSADDFLAFQPELLYSAKGAKDSFYAGSNTDRLHYLDVPLLARIKAGGLFFELGPQVSYLLAVRNEGPTGTYTDVSSHNRLAAGALAGIGYRLPMGLGLGLRYAHDFTQVTPQGPRNNVFQMQASYLLPGK